VHGLQALGVLVGLVLGAQVHRADGIALALQIVEVGLDAGGVGGDGHGFVGQALAELLGLDPSGLADLGGDLGQAVGGGLQAGGQGGAQLAAFGRGGVGRSHGPIRLGAGALGGGERIGGLRPAGLGDG
jgi:hypothetical protein